MCYSKSSLMLTQKPFTACRVVGLTALRRRGNKNALSFHQCPTPTTQDGDICIFFHNRPSSPYSRGVFAFRNTELLIFTLLQGYRVATSSMIALHLPSHVSSLFTENQVKGEPAAFRKGGKIRVCMLTPWLTQLSVNYVPKPLINWLMKKRRPCETA